MQKRVCIKSTTSPAIRPRNATRWNAGPIGFAPSSRRRPPMSGNSVWWPMRDPTTNLGVEELIEVAIQYLCERDWRGMIDEIDANPAICESFTKGPMLCHCQLPARKPGRPSQRRDRHVQIAGAVAMLREDFGLRPTRSHCGRQRQPSGCSIVTAALKQLGEHLDERTVEGIWDRCCQSPLINHPAV